MNQLKTSPVVVIDDQRDEALPVMEALGRLGVGCVYVPGDRFEDLPRPPIPGVRLVFMDMLLGTQGGAREIGTQAAKVFATSIDSGASPIVIVLWTKHREYVDEFKRALFENEPRLRVGTVVTQLEKPEKAEEIDVEALKQNISSLVDGLPPLRFLWFWEQLARDAATKTSGALGELVAGSLNLGEGTTDEERLAAWCNGMRYVLRCLVQVACGQNVNPGTACRDLLEVFAQLHQDRLEHEVIGGVSGPLDEILGVDWNGPSPEVQMEINTMLLVAPAHPDDVSVRPGSLYLPQEKLGDLCLHRMCRVDAEAIGREILQPTKDTQYATDKKLLDKYRQRKEPDADIRNVEEKLSERFRQIVAECLPTLVEISPGCDYAQCNRRVARFVGGLLVPEQHSKLIVGHKESIRTIPAVRLPGIAGMWHPVFSARFPYTLPDPEKVVKSKPICRLRTPVLIAILHWCAAQASRPDYLSLE